MTEKKREAEIALGMLDVMDITMKLHKIGGIFFSKPVRRFLIMLMNGLTKSSGSGRM